MSSFVGRSCGLLCLLLSCCLIAQHRASADDVRPYEFSFNIVDFQHRYERKDAAGIVTGEYGFITSDGVYHETGYTTDKNGDFIITRMKNRKITSLKDAQEVFKDRPEAAKKLVEAVARACANCKVLPKQEDDRAKPAKLVTEPPLQKRTDSVMKQMMRILLETVKPVERDVPLKKISEKRDKIVRKESSSPRSQPKEDVVRSMVRAAKKLLSRENSPDKVVVSDRVLEKMANDLYYQFNYTITTHGHHETGYRNGRKDGSYQSQSENGVDTRVRYLSNEFGHQPNITFVPQAGAPDEEHALKGYSFRWYWS